eukprot:6482864-Amphidinium_carterae.1
MPLVIVVIHRESSKSRVSMQVALDIPHGSALGRTLQRAIAESNGHLDALTSRVMQPPAKSLSLIRPLLLPALN